MSGNRIADMGKLLDDYGQKQIVLQLESLVSQYKRHDSLDPAIYICIGIAIITGIYCPVAIMMCSSVRIIATLAILCMGALCVMLALCLVRSRRLDKSTIQTRIVALAKNLKDADLREMYTNFGKYPESCVSIL